MNCTEFAELAPDLALGQLSEPERARALSHALSCRACRNELASLSSMVDELALLAPPVEPPVGFEQRAVSALTAAGSALVRAEVRPSRRRYRRLAPAAVAAALAAGLAGGWGLARPGTGKPTPVLVHGELSDQGRPVGEVIAYSGASPWLYMTVDIGHLNGVVQCVVEDGGHSVAMGSFSVANGLGYWSAPLRVPVARLDGAKLVQPDGTVLATAVLGSG